MVQLTDDCFVSGGSLKRLDDALALLRARLVPVSEIEQVGLAEATGRFLGVDLSALHSVPPFFNSAVDGYAFRHADLGPGPATRLPIAGRAAAGHPTSPLAPGQAVRIFTGAPMPSGADTVVMQEDTDAIADSVLVPAGLRCGANARPAGEDLEAGETILRAGRRLGPAELALAAASGHANVPVRARLRVAVFSTGDELAEPGATLRPGAIHDSNRVMLRALLLGLGARVTDLGILADDRHTISAALSRAAQEHDLLVTSGGVSAGEEDHVKAAVEAAGALHLWRIAIKPGRPVALGRVATAAFAGLPGNPAAVMTTFLFLLRPVALMLAGAAEDPPARITVRSGFACRKKEGRREYVRVSLRPDGIAERFPREGAGLLSSMTQTDGLVELEESVTTIGAGDPVVFLPWRGLL